MFVSHVVSLRLDALNDHTFDVRSQAHTCRMERSSMVAMYGDCMVGLVRHGKVLNVVVMVGLVRRYCIERSRNGWPSTPR